ncbi:hypothetical protein Y032_0931g3097, partial [Ancylostoma ceylanicum]
MYNVCQNHLLITFVEKAETADAEKLSLLSHPLAVALVKYKWNSLGKYAYYFALTIYVVFLCFLTLFITYTPAPFNVYDETREEVVDLSPYLSESNADCPHIKVTRSSWLVAIKWGVITLGILELIKELFQFITRRTRYFTFDNGIECFVYSSAIVIVVDLSPCSQQTGLRMPEFSSVPSSVLKTAVMMMGEFEFTAIFHGDEKSHIQRLFGPTIAYPLFLFFCVIMTILLMNLLVGLAVDDIKTVQEGAELKSLSKQ